MISVYQRDELRVITAADSTDTWVPTGKGRGNRTLYMVNLGLKGIPCPKEKLSL